MNQEIEVEEERVKSALEIAMERISGLPELTPEEIAEQKEKEFQPVGEALANKYVQDIVDGHAVQTELSRHQGDSGRAVRRAYISRLCSSIQLEDSRVAVKALNGLYSLPGDMDDLRKKADASWKYLFDSYEQNRNKMLTEYEADEKKNLAGFGISGSAVRPNLADNESLEKELDELRRSFEPEVEKLRAMLLRELQTE